MTLITDITGFLEKLAPLSFAESWDNVGLLMGDSKSSVQRIMTCLTVSQTTADEAIRQQCNLIVSHHPIPFRPLNRITTSEPTGKLLWKLANAGISVYSPHTAWDNAEHGINQQIAEAVGLTKIRPLKPVFGGNELSGIGVGRVGEFSQAQTPKLLVKKLMEKIPYIEAKIVAQAETGIVRIGIVCGSGASLLELAGEIGCDCFITGEANYHQCLEAAHRNITLILLGHHGSERFAMDVMAEIIGQEFPDLTVWASRDECDPTASSFAP